ncbi:hypothetical protein ACN47E_004915 [Coniothyrium glycines]
MRLLRLNADGSLSLVELLSRIPPYAILSHTWAEDPEDEVSFQDMQSDSGRDKLGYAKIEFCVSRIKEDKFSYFWIDTCCIDKSSSAEQAEAINSMFRWYQEAAKCYVLLTDVPSPYDSACFQGSRWFTRGWTLQELLAPRIVEFYSSDGIKFGDKYSLVEPITEATNLPVQAVQGGDLSQFGVDERFRWAQNRKTKKPEDAAYSLVGIFGTSMPPIYGEGRRIAFHRLRVAIESIPGTRNDDENEDSLDNDPLIIRMRTFYNFPGRTSNLTVQENRLLTTRLQTSAKVLRAFVLVLFAILNAPLFMRPYRHASARVVLMATLAGILAFILHYLFNVKIKDVSIGTAVYIIVMALLSISTNHS